MKKIAAMTLAAALASGAALTLSTRATLAAPVGVMAGVLDAGQPVVEQVQYRGRRVVRRRGGGNGAGLAAGLIGAAIVGGAIIAQSQRDRAEERAYYYGQPTYSHGYYDPNGYYYQQPPARSYYAPQYSYPVQADPYHPRHSHFPRHPVRDPAGGGIMR